MDTIKSVRDQLNHLKSVLSFFKQPKMDKIRFDTQRIDELTKEIKILEEKLVELKSNL